MTLWMLAADAWEARRPEGEGPAPRMAGDTYDIASGVAQIRLAGVIAPGAGFWWGDMVDPASLADAIRKADADPAVTEIRLLVDSPGGSGSAMRDAHLALRNCSKPTMAYIADKCASAAYWIASGCDRVVAHPLAMVGCIGSIVRASEWRGPGETRKAIRTSSTPNKAPDLGDPQWDAQWQAVVDHAGGLFLTDVAAARGWPAASVDALAERTGRGAIMTAPAALAAGLIDEITDAPAGAIVAGSTDPAGSPRVERASAAVHPPVDATRSVRPAATAGPKTTRGASMDELEKVTAERDALATRIAELEAEIAKMRDEKAAGDEADEQAGTDEVAEQQEARIAALEAALRDEKRDRYIDARLAAGELTPAVRGTVVKLYALGGEAEVETVFPKGKRLVPAPVGHGQPTADAGNPWGDLKLAAQARVDAAAKAGKRLTYDRAVNEEIAARRR